ncbi:ArsR/SmtB family transcription factor [Streptomyces corynorhini]|uniref:ArsR family transcriptional regulator n=1 Tax=Streptomyces corynorhini TaxID=2282652 RepID=A0A370AX68_9ACTN|nr:DUF5937 family protein [Streptomyces corynorhini]RDG34190.1 ArsR family transcriptional regulator [Streptomyces corynorhini]
MLRIHFTGRDVETLRIADRPDPLWEIVCSLCRLQDRWGRIAFEQWRRETVGRLLPGEAVWHAVRGLYDLVPGRSTYFPDFLTPPVVPGLNGLHAGIDRVLSTPRDRLHTEIGLLTTSTKTVPAAAGQLARGDTAALKRLGDDLLTYHDTFVAPLWPRIETAVAMDVARRTRALVTGGTRGLLETFRPVITWRSPVLWADYPVDRDMYLEGRGLLLVPSYFCWRRPITVVDQDLQPVLVYPVDKLLVPAAGTGPAAPASGLAKLLGPTRAALLHETAARDCVSTSALAGLALVSLPSVSQQLAILRDAGLVASRRDGKYVRHSVTPLGRRLLGTDTGTR